MLGLAVLFLVSFLCGSCIDRDDGPSFVGPAIILLGLEVFLTGLIWQDINHWPGLVPAFSRWVSMMAAAVFSGLLFGFLLQRFAKKAG